LQNKGSFREMLRFRINAENSVLEIHVKNSVHKATYISRTTQKQLIEVIGGVIREVILKRIKIQSISQYFYRDD
jgi:hypothetical protein